MTSATGLLVNNVFFRLFDFSFKEKLRHAIFQSRMASVVLAKRFEEKILVLTYYREDLNF